jgi:hypothetical protein
MFTFTYDEFNSVSLEFENEFLKLECVPESSEYLDDHGYSSCPSNGEFEFYFNEETITFNAAKRGDGQGGTLTITLKMTKEIRESLEKAMEDWRVFLLKIDREECAMMASIISMI